MGPGEAIRLGEAIRSGEAFRRERQSDRETGGRDRGRWQSVTGIESDFQTIGPLGYLWGWQGHGTARAGCLAQLGQLLGSRAQRGCMGYFPRSGQRHGDRHRERGGVRSRRGRAVDRTWYRSLLHLYHRFRRLGPHRLGQVRHRLGFVCVLVSVRVYVRFHASARARNAHLCEPQGIDLPPMSRWWW